MNREKSSQSGNAAIIVLAVLAVIAVGAGAYLYGQMAGEKIQTQDSNGLFASDDITPGESNPVVATVDGKTVTRAEVFNFIRTLPENLRVVPLDQIYPVALEQVIGNKIVEDKVKAARLGNDAEVKRQMEQAKRQIMRTVYLEQEAARGITVEKLQEAYEQYRETFPAMEEAKARHIVLKEESKAKEIIKKLKDGGDFETLAKEASVDPTTASSGGDLGYFLKKDVVPEFGEAVFKLKAGEYTKKPVKTTFGYHVIKLEDKRDRAPETFEQRRPRIEAELRPVILEQSFRNWREQANIERFDINGKPLEPAAGGDAAPETAQEDKAAMQDEAAK